MRKLKISLGVSLALSIIISFLIASIFDLNWEGTGVTLVSGFAAWSFFEANFVRHLFSGSGNGPLFSQFLTASLFALAILTLFSTYLTEAGPFTSITYGKSFAWSVISVSAVEVVFAVFVSRYKQRNRLTSPPRAEHWVNEYEKWVN